MSTTLEREATDGPARSNTSTSSSSARASRESGRPITSKTQNPDRTFVILEAQDSFGGTWHTHRYPGIRSDSDLYTFGYRFKPWTSAPIATAAEIQKYLERGDRRE